MMRFSRSIASAIFLLAGILPSGAEAKIDSPLAEGPAVQSAFAKALSMSWQCKNESAGSRSCEGKIGTRWQQSILIQTEGRSILSAYVGADMRPENRAGSIAFLRAALEVIVPKWPAAARDAWLDKTIQLLPPGNAWVIYGGDLEGPVIRGSRLWSARLHRLSDVMVTLTIERPDHD